MAIIEQVRTDLTTAMKAGEKDRVGALRLVLSELQRAVKDGNADELAVLRRERKRRLDAATQFRAAGAPSSAAQEECEAELITGYLPTSCRRRAGRDRRGGRRRDGRERVKDMGQVMKAVMARGAGRVDGKRVSARVRGALRA